MFSDTVATLDFQLYIPYQSATLALYFSLCHVPTDHRQLEIKKIIINKPTHE